VERCRDISGEGSHWWRVVNLSVEKVVIGGELSVETVVIGRESSRYQWRRK